VVIFIYNSFAYFHNIIDIIIPLKVVLFLWERNNSGKVHLLSLDNCARSNECISFSLALYIDVCGDD